MRNETRQSTVEPSVIPWTEARALSRARIDVDASRTAQLDHIRGAVDAGRLPDQAVEALIAAGWTELDD